MNGSAPLNSGSSNYYAKVREVATTAITQAPEGIEASMDQIRLLGRTEAPSHSLINGVLNGAARRARFEPPENSVSQKAGALAALSGLEPTESGTWNARSLAGGAVAVKRLAGAENGLAPLHVVESGAAALVEVAQKTGIALGLELVQGSHMPASLILDLLVGSAQPSEPQTYREISESALRAKDRGYPQALENGVDELFTTIDARLAAKVLSGQSIATDTAISSLARVGVNGGLNPSDEMTSLDKNSHSYAILKAVSGLSTLSPEGLKKSALQVVRAIDSGEVSGDLDPVLVARTSALFLKGIGAAVGLKEVPEVGELEERAKSLADPALTTKEDFASKLSLSLQHWQQSKGSREDAQFVLKRQLFRIESSASRGQEFPSKVVASVLRKCRERGGVGTRQLDYTKGAVMVLSSLHKPDPVRSAAAQLQSMRSGGPYLEGASDAMRALCQSEMGTKTSRTELVRLTERDYSQAIFALSKGFGESNSPSSIEEQVKDILNHSLDSTRDDTREHREFVLGETAETARALLVGAENELDDLNHLLSTVPLSKALVADIRSAVRLCEDKPGPETLRTMARDYLTSEAPERGLEVVSSVFLQSDYQQRLLEGARELGPGAERLALTYLDMTNSGEQAHGCLKDSLMSANPKKPEDVERLAQEAVLLKHVSSKDKSTAILKEILRHGSSVSTRLAQRVAKDDWSSVEDLEKGLVDCLTDVSGKGAERLKNLQSARILAGIAESLDPRNSTAKELLDKTLEYYKLGGPLQRLNKDWEGEQELQARLDVIAGFVGDEVTPRSIAKAASDFVGDSKRARGASGALNDACEIRGTDLQKELSDQVQLEASLPWLAVSDSAEIFPYREFVATTATRALTRGGNQFKRATESIHSVLETLNEAVASDEVSTLAQVFGPSEDEESSQGVLAVATGLSNGPVALGLKERLAKGPAEGVNRVKTAQGGVWALCHILGEEGAESALRQVGLDGPGQLLNIMARRAVKESDIGRLADHSRRLSARARDSFRQGLNRYEALHDSARILGSRAREASDGYRVLEQDENCRRLEPFVSWGSTSPGREAPIHRVLGQLDKITNKSELAKLRARPSFSDGQEKLEERFFVELEKSVES